MKKLLTLTAVGAMLATPASAVQKCVALDTTTKASSYGGNQEELNWFAIILSTQVSGIGVCSDMTGTTNRPQITMTVNSSDLGSHANCWCKMTNPAVSPWVFSQNLNHGQTCYSICSSICANSVATNFNFRAAMLSGLSD